MTIREAAAWTPTYVVASALRGRARTSTWRLRLVVVLLFAALFIATASRRGGGEGAFAAEIGQRVAAPAISPADRAVSAAQLRLATNRNDASAKKSLAAALLQKVRETADPAYYTAVGDLLKPLGGPRSSDPEVLLLEGTLLLARHQFAEALDVGTRAANALGSNASAQGILVDAYNELGRYPEALAATQRMVDRRPDLAALSRVSYARELRGDLPGAIEAMQQAVVAGQGSGENVAYVQTLLANLLVASGESDQAASSYAAALRSFPGFAAARAGEASLLYARGRPAEAARMMADVVGAQPLLAYVIAEGDYYRAAKMMKQARDAYALVDAIEALQRANGVDVDIELAVYRADHGRTNGLLASTRRAVARRPGVAGRDALAWVLHRTGNHAEAAAEIAKVLDLGDRDPVYRFHAAAIALAVNDRTLANEQFNLVLRSNPHAVGISPDEFQKLARALGRTVPRST